MVCHHKSSTVYNSNSQLVGAITESWIAGKNNVNAENKVQLYDHLYLGQ